MFSRSVLPLDRTAFGLLIAWCAVISLMPVALAAQPAGTISGIVTNAATGQPLKGAAVTVSGRDISAASDATGEFRLPFVPAGVHSIVIRYAGFDLAKTEVVVVPGQVAQVGIALTSGIYQLGEFVVSADREGQAAAINAQRQADHGKLVASSDAFGNLVNGNVGEFLKNLPGVNPEYDGVEAGGVRLRGFDPALSSVTMDGNRLANSGNGNANGTRAFDIRELAIQNIETIEINKAPTPAQPANALGGSVNFITKSAFAQKGRRVRVDVNISLNSELLSLKKTPGGERTPNRMITPGFGLNYSEAFGTTRPIGVALHVTYSPTVRYNMNYGPSYQFGTFNAAGAFTAAPAGTRITADTPGRVTGITWNEIISPDVRRSASLNLDQKLSSTTSIFIYSSYSQKMVDGAVTHVYRVTPTVQSVGSGFNQIIAPRNPNNQFGQMNTNITNRLSQVLAVNPGAKHRFGETTLNYDFSYSRSFHRFLPETSTTIGYNLPDVGYTVQGIAGPSERVTVAQTAGASALELNNYGRLFYNTLEGLSINRLAAAKVDLRRPIGLPWRTVLQSGANYIREEREISDPNRRYNLTGLNGVQGDADDPTLGQFADVYHRANFPHAVAVPVWLDSFSLLDYFQANPRQFTFDESRAIDTAAANLKHVTENTAAAYAMVTTKRGPLTLLGGLRYERTMVSAEGRVFQSRAGDPGRPDFIADPLERRRFKNRIRERRYRTYEDYFPNLQLKHEPFDGLIFRASFTTNIGRPDFVNIIPGDTVDEVTRVIAMNNTALKPQRGRSYELGAEYYLPHAGLVSVAVYRKTITDYINAVSYLVTAGAQNGFDGEYEGFQVNTRGNIGTAQIDGGEASYNYNFRNLPGPWRNLTSFATYTRLTASGDLPLTAIVPHTFNVGIGYAGARFSGNLKYNVRTRTVASLDTFGVPTYLEKNDRLDVGLTLRVGKHWTTYFDWRNVLRESDRRTVFGRTAQYFRPGMALNVGARANF
jgi:TonB-dependent receptor